MHSCWNFVFLLVFLEYKPKVLEVIGRHEVSRNQQSAIPSTQFWRFESHSPCSDRHMRCAEIGNVLVHPAGEIILRQFATRLVIGASVELNALQVARDNMLAFSYVRIVS